MVEQVTKAELTELLKQAQLLQSKLVILLSRYEQTETIRTEIAEPVWASTGTDSGQEVVHTA